LGGAIWGIPVYTEGPENNNEFAIWKGGWGVPNSKSVRALLTSSIAAGLTACSVSHVDVRLERDLSGTFKTIMSVNRQIEACAEMPAALRELTEQALAGNPDMRSVFQVSPYNAGDAGGVQAAFHFDSPEDISLRVGQLQQLDIEPTDPDEQGISQAKKELRESVGKLMAQFDSLPVDFTPRIEPVIRPQGEVMWRAEFEGDPGVLANLNFGKDTATHCSPESISFTVTMPVPIKDFSPRSGRASGVLQGSHRVVWTIPREGGGVLLSVTASEPDPDWQPPWSEWLSAHTWIPFVTLITTILGALVAWRQFRKKE
jgi:hypothetical protein